MVEQKDLDCFENGHCAAHGGEVERRKEAREEVARLEDKLSALSDKIDGKLGKLWKQIAIGADFRAGAKIVGIIGIVLFASAYLYTTYSFFYTNKHIEFSIREHDAIRRALKTSIDASRSTQNYQIDRMLVLIDANENRIASLETQDKLTSFKLASIQNSTTRIESRLSQLVNILAEADQIDAKEKNQWDFDSYPPTGAGGAK